MHGSGLAMVLENGSNGYRPSRTSSNGLRPLQRLKDKTRLFIVQHCPRHWGCPAADAQAASLPGGSRDL